MVSCSLKLAIAENGQILLIKAVPHREQVLRVVYWSVVVPRRVRVVKLERELL